MWISYSDSEVNKFHPICQKAWENALAQIGKKDEFSKMWKFIYFKQGLSENKGNDITINI